jgi:hypothetical protein
MYIMSDWTTDIESVLEAIRTNSIAMSEHHKKRYFYYKDKLKYFRFPLIILSALNSVFSVGLQPYMEQPTISILNCLLSLFCGIITSIELYLGIQASMENELMTSKDFYLLGVDIFKNLHLEKDHRTKGGRVFLEEKYSDYVKLIENGNLINKKTNDSLAPIEEAMLASSTPTSSKKPSLILTSPSNSSFGIEAAEIV